MKVQLIRKLRHRFVPGITEEQYKSLLCGHPTEVSDDTMDWLCQFAYVKVVDEPKPTAKKVKAEKPLIKETESTKEDE